LAVIANDGLHLHRIDQVRLVEADDRLDPALRRTRQVAVDQVLLELWLFQGDDDHHLIDVGDQHVLAAARFARQDSVAWLDGFDGAFARQVPLGAYAFAVHVGIVGAAGLLEAARPALVARRLAAILAQVHTLFLFRHAAIVSETTQSTPWPWLASLAQISEPE